MSVAEIESSPLWAPSPERIERAAITRFIAHVNEERGLALGGYDALHDYSVTDVEGFWTAIWSFFSVDAETAPTAVLAPASMPHAKWFPGATLNYAHHALRHAADAPAVIVEREDGTTEHVDVGTLRQRVGAAQKGLARLGVGRGDRVAALLPNGLEALVGMLATAGLGAVWTSCSPDHGGQAARMRFEQVGPRVLIAADGYRYGGRTYSTTETIAELRRTVTTLEATVLVGQLGTGAQSAGTSTWDELVAQPAEPTFAAVPFDHPLWILYSSGTTGPPKAIVHGHGGILLEHFKALGLHTDVGPGDRLFWFTTTGWMMWNYLVSGLLLGTTVVLYDGSPGHPDPERLWQLAERHEITVFGTSAGYLEARRREGARPRERHRLILRTISSTGSPLAPEAARWASEAVTEGVMVASVSGGSDVCSGLVGAAPILPLHADRIQRPMLGCDVDAYSPDGRSLRGVPGELVVKTPMPSMPVGLWNDDDGRRYRDAYFSKFDGVWNHGDLFVMYDDRSCAVLGRSDATLNRGGVRMGTAEFYAALEDLDSVGDSLVVDVRDSLWLLVVPSDRDAPPQPGDVKAYLRSALSPRHVPDRIEVVAAIPRTRTGKRLELPAKHVLLGRDPADVADPSALENPSALDELIRLRPTGG